MSSRPSAAVCTVPGRSTVVPCDGSWVVSPVPSPGPRLRPRCRWCRSLGLPADIQLGCRRSANEPACNPPPYPRSRSYVPACRGSPPPGAVCCLAPFCAAYGLIASPGPSAMRMNLDVACVDHQPLKVRIFDDPLQQLVPDTAVSPPAKASMGVLPVPVIRRQVPPGRPSTQDPKHRVQEKPVIPGWTPPFACSTRQVRSQLFPNLVRKVVTPMRCRHTSTPHTHTLRNNLPSCSCFDDTP